MFSDEGIPKIKYWRKASPVIILTAKEDRWASVRNEQEHHRESSHGYLGELDLGLLLLLPGYDSAKQGCDRINCLTCSFMLFIFLNIGFGYNCIKLYHFLQLDNDFILFCILQVRWQ